MKHAVTLAALAAASILGVAACGGGTGTSATPAASQTASASPSLTPPHTAQPGEPALITVPGYAYTNATGDGAAAAKMLINADPQDFKSWSAHNVMREGTEIGGIILVQVKPRYAGLPQVRQAMVPAMADAMAGSGAKTTLETIHNEKVAMTTRDSSDVYLWYHNGAITIVIGDNGKGPDMRNFVQAYLKTANG
jgi:hypothetical protein